MLLIVSHGEFGVGIGVVVAKSTSATAGESAFNLEEVRVSLGFHSLATLD